MTTAELLSLDDRCRRFANWSLIWDRPRLRPLDILRKCVDAGLTTEDANPGDLAGAEVMSLFSMRQVEVKVNELYDVGVHYAHLADLITSVLRGAQSPMGLPADVVAGEHPWESACFLEPSGVRLRRILLLDRLSEETLEGIKRSWDTFGESCLYKMPVTVSILIVGQQRDGRRVSPWSKGWLHPVGNQNLRFKKRDGSGLNGTGWKSVFREHCDHLTRDYWIERMRADEVFQDLMLDIEIPVPPTAVVRKVVGLAKKKLDRILATKETPEPEISQCYRNSPCPFVGACWTFREPNEQLGFVRL